MKCLTIDNTINNNSISETIETMRFIVLILMRMTMMKMIALSLYHMFWGVFNNNNNSNKCLYLFIFFPFLLLLPLPFVVVVVYSSWGLNNGERGTSKSTLRVAG